MWAGLEDRVRQRRHVSRQGENASSVEMKGKERPSDKTVATITNLLESVDQNRRVQ
jgi:hypothetical protein